MLAGAVGFLLMLRSLPPTSWRILIAQVGPALPVAAGISLGWMAFYARGLRAIVDGAIGWGRLVYNRVVGDAYNVIAPVGGVGGDPIRILDLAGEIGSPGAVRAIVLDRLVYSTAGLVFSAVGSAVAVAAFTWDRRLEHLVVGYVVVALAVAVGLSLLATRPEAARGIGRLLRLAKMRLPQLPSPLPMKLFARALGWHLLGRAGSLVEIGILLLALGQPVRLSAMVAIGALVSVAGILFFFVPNGVGVNEGATVFALTLTGYTESAGLALGLARRVRQLLMTAVGVALTMIRGAGRAEDAAGGGQAAIAPGRHAIFQREPRRRS
jgi:uncharacterized membrane protein YbhN (UPF0104 family)